MSFLGHLFGRGGPPPPTALHEESRKLGKLLAEIFSKVEPSIVAGTSTAEINTVVEAQISKHGVTSMFRKLGFPGSCTTSIDAEVINVPPSSRRLETGQLMKLQIGITGTKTHATQAWTYAIGPRDDEAQRLVTAGIEALRLAVAAARSGNRVGAISAAIQGRIEAEGYMVNRQFIGNGVDTRPHADPPIPGFGNPASGPRLREGGILSLNIIAHAGSFQCKQSEDDNKWAIVATDGRRSVHFGQMVIAGVDTAEVITVERPQ